MGIDDYISYYRCNSPNYLIDDAGQRDLQKAPAGYGSTSSGKFLEAILLNSPPEEGQGLKRYLNISERKDYTISCWVYLDFDSFVYNDFPIFYTGNPVGAVGTEYNDIIVKVSTDAVDASFSINDDDELYTMAHDSTAQWVHVIVTKNFYNTGDHNKLIINGISNTYTMSTEHSRDYVYFAYTGETDLIGFDEIRFYNRCLTVSECLDLHNYVPVAPSSPTSTTEYIQYTNTPTWTWDRPSGAVNFEIFLDDSTVAEYATDTSYTPSSPLSYGLHYIKIKAGNGSAYSSEVVFDVACLYSKGYMIPLDDSEVAEYTYTVGESISDSNISVFIYEAGSSLLDSEVEVFEFISINGDSDTVYFEYFNEDDSLDIALLEVELNNSNNPVLSWERVPYAQSYDIYKYTPEEKTSALDEGIYKYFFDKCIYTTNVTCLNYEDSNTNEFTPYYYCVKPSSST